MDSPRKGDLEQALGRQFPLVSQLRFTHSLGRKGEQLPALISLLVSMTNPKLPGDTCVLLPSRGNVAFLVAIVSALTANRDHYAARLKKYIDEGFNRGDRVRVLPKGDVYIFDGYFHEPRFGSTFFKLRCLDDDTHARASFPINRAVRLEKTTASAPKGNAKGWGAPNLSALDRVLGTETYGNHCLFTNEIMLVGTKKEFLEFLDSVSIFRPENGQFSTPLSEVIPWGFVTPEGLIEFGNNAAAEGQPIIAVSPRLEYIAAACRANQEVSPRVIIDGANRVRDLQAFDDVVDNSKLLVVADHSDVEHLGDLAKRECTVWKLPDEVKGLIGEGSSLLKEFQEKYDRAAGLNFNSYCCESKLIDSIALELLGADKKLREEEVDEPTERIKSIAFSKLLDLAAILHTPQKGEFSEALKRLDEARRSLYRQKDWISGESFSHLSNALDGIIQGFSQESEGFQTSKRVRLLEELEAIRMGGKSCAIVCQNVVAAESARCFLTESSLEDVIIQNISEHTDGTAFDEIILTGWPRSRNFSRLWESYNSRKITCLSYGIEHKWFSGAVRKRSSFLSRWRGDLDLFRSLTGLDSTIEIDPEVPSNEPGDDGKLFAGVASLEMSVSQVRKGTKAGPVSQLDAREAKYIGFQGKSYAYLSQDRKIPKVTNIIRGVSVEGKSVPLTSVDELRLGDYVLWRAHAGSDKDMVRLIAEQGMRNGEYESIRKTASRWKVCLKSLANTEYKVWQKLSEAGLTKTEATVHNWLTYEEMIGPSQVEDLHVIARAAGQSDFEREIPETWAAIKTVRGAHMEAGYKLSQLLFEKLPGQLPELNDAETLVDLTLEDSSIGAVWILQVELISSEYEKRPYWEVNSLLWDEV